MRTGLRGRWVTLAKDIIKRNDIARSKFAKAVWELLEKDRGKYRNILITGPANCGKTFILLPITVICQAFSNPANSTFAWVGAEKAEVIIRNDFRCRPELIAWLALLLMLEGGLVHLPTPKTHFSKDMTLAGMTPIFATSKEALLFIKGGAIEERETEMMSVRLDEFTFRSQIPATEQECVSPCGHCFSFFIIENLKEGHETE
ncbi:hypothetical protein HOLleu_20838 [Holothuria leucospilota]|uniref:Parvovirus non-structural protein 1 helicase domain-containing protein n=1 Tax=Holothuria leucospilota TaxID=206669 RepID=A0A9Q1H5K8_HOLLE|nr:hypothetical protein HOLleu_20838 [Holothuria leucospilota]